MKHWQKIGIVFFIVVAIAGINTYDAFESYTAPTGTTTTRTTTTTSTTTNRAASKAEIGIIFLVIVSLGILLMGGLIMITK